VSDPRTGAGVRVPVLEVGSLTSRLLFATLDASAETADALRAESRDSLLANADGAPDALTRRARNVCRADLTQLPILPREGGRWSPWRHHPFHHPLIVVSRASAKARINKSHSGTDIAFRNRLGG
jgi:hypothetical protein